MERSLSMELVRVTEAAALASARWMVGKKMRLMKRQQVQ